MSPGGREGRASLLRGINVGGNHKIPMPRLRDLYVSLGFDDVASYIQSGNVVFRTTGNASDRSGDVQAAIAAEFGWPIRVLERSHAELRRLLTADPFPGADAATRHVMFLFDQPSADVLETLGHVAVGEDEARIIGREIHLCVPGGFGRTGLLKVLTERRLGVSATTRNWRTVNALGDLTA